MVRIERPGVAAPPGGVAGHASETSLGTFHLRLVNDGPLEVLAERAAGLLARVATLQPPPLSQPQDRGAAGASGAH